MFMETRATPTGTEKRYRNMDRTDMVVASQEPDSKWYAKGLGETANFYFLTNAGYATEAACQTAIKAALSVP